MGDFDGLINPFQRFSSKKSSRASISFGVSEYTGQSFISKSDLRFIAWSYGHSGGNLSAAFLSKIL